jgi:hypothetical protein
MPLSSASSSRPKLIFENGSVSDSGLAPRSHRSLGVPSAHKGPISLLDVRHPSSSSPNLSLPGYLSDSGISERSASPLHATRLDVKRLLSKPAAPSVASVLSITSDTDPEPHTLPRPPLNSSEAWPSKTRVQAQPRPRLISSTMSRSESSEPEQPLASPPPSLQQRPKVLRKKSTSGQNHRTVMSAAPRDDTSNSSPLRSTHQAAAPGSPRGRRSNPLQSLIRSRAAVPTSAPTYGSGRLTPAGAIAQAYKEQDIRRGVLAATASADTMLPVIPVSASLLDAFEYATLEQKPHANVKSAPGDIRLGNSIDSFVLVDSAEEALCHGNEQNPSVPRSGDNSVSASASRPVKSLTRKISAPLRHGPAAVNGAEARSEQGHGSGRTQTGHLRGSIDVGDLNQHKAKRKSKYLGLSLNTPLSSSGSEDVLVDRSGPPLPGESVPDSTDVLSQSKGKEKVQEKGDAGTGTRLWRLVKRISTGGLRERFQTPGAPTPPVPTIPKDLPSPNTVLEVQAPSESTSRGGGSDTGHGGNGGVRHSIDSSDVSPQSDRVASLPTETHTSLQGNDAFSNPRRPSLSSSPQSSEPTTSTHFFRSHSSRSSFSSVVATSPPPPPVPIRKRTPSLQNRLRKKNDTTSPGPETPTFSISDVVNNFVSRRPSLARHQRRHAPARSLPRIEPPPIGEVSGALLRRAGSEARSSTRRHRRFDPILTPVSSGQNRDSQGSDSTLRPLGASSGSDGGGLAGQCTFREIGSARGAWTSQEKEDKWDDLLERSARAGGTLHLGVGSTHLASDDIRFSSGTLELET